MGYQTDLFDNLVNKFNSNRLFCTLIVDVTFIPATKRSSVTFLSESRCEKKIVDLSCLLFFLMYTFSSLITKFFIANVINWRFSYCLVNFEC